MISVPAFPLCLLGSEYEKDEGVMARLIGIMKTMIIARIRKRGNSNTVDRYVDGCRWFLDRHVHGSYTEYVCDYLIVKGEDKNARRHIH